MYPNILYFRKKKLSQKLLNFNKLILPELKFLKPFINPSSTIIQTAEEQLAILTSVKKLAVEDLVKFF